MCHALVAKCIQRTHTGRSFSPSSSDVFDCGASSGYGSPGTMGTPLSSPAPHVFSLPSHVQHALCDPGCVDETEHVASLGPTVIDHEHNKKVFIILSVLPVQVSRMHPVITHSLSVFPAHCETFAFELRTALHFTPVLGES